VYHPLVSIVIICSALISYSLQNSFSNTSRRTSKLTFCEILWNVLRQFVIELISMQVSQTRTINLSGRGWQINKNETCLLIPPFEWRNIPFNYIDVISEFMRSAERCIRLEVRFNSAFERVQKPADIRPGWVEFPGILALE